MNKIWMLRLAVLLMLAFLAGCSQYKAEKKRNRYDYTIHQYEKAIRWGSYEIANTYRDPEREMDQEPDFEHMKQFAVTHYELLSEKFTNDYTISDMTIAIRYYNKQTMTEREVVDKQIWIWDAEKEIWYLDSPLPTFQ